MSSVMNWARRQLQDFQPWVDAVQEWRTVRRRDKAKAEQEKADRARKSLEKDWLQVDRRSNRVNEQSDTVQLEEEDATNQGQQPHANQNTEELAEVMYVDDTEHKDDQSQQGQAQTQKEGYVELVWQEHIRRCLMIYGWKRNQDRSHLWDQVREGFESGAGLEPERPSTPEVLVNADAQRQARRDAQKQQKAFEEAYRERKGLLFESRRQKERASTF